MTDEQIKTEAEKANGYSYFGKGRPISNAFNEGFEVGFKYHRDNDPLRKEVEELIDKLESMSNNYEIIGGCYVIQKLTLDLFIEQELDQILSK